MTASEYPPKDCNDPAYPRSQHDWSGLLAFFGEPLELYVKERTAYRERYLKFLHEGISHALLDSNVILARRLHKLKIPLDFDTALIVNGDQCKVKKVVIPDNLYGTLIISLLLRREMS